MKPSEYLRSLYGFAIPDFPDWRVNLAAWNEEEFAGTCVTLKAIENEPKKIDDWFAKQQEEKKNIGHVLNFVKADTQVEKARIADLVPRFFFIGSDIDPEEGDGEDWKLDKLEELNGIKCSALNDTGNGFQIVHRLREPYGETKARQLLKDYREETGGDPAACNLAQVYRVPDSINFPNEAKRKKGRVECEAKNIRLDPAHVLDMKPRDPFLDSLPLSAEMRLFMETGRLGATVEDDPSKIRGRILDELVAAGWIEDEEDEDAHTLLEYYPTFAMAPSNSRKNTFNWRKGELRRALERLPEWLKEMNEELFVVMHGGKTAVGQKVKTGFGRHEAERFEFVTPQAKAAWYENKKVKIGDRRVPQWSAWMKNPHRRTYKRAVLRPDLEPGKLPNGDLNLWQGFTVKPKPGEFPLFREVVEHLVCGDDPVVIDYVWKWLAFGVQHPELQHRVALVMRGKQGTGKGTLANTYGSLFGMHYLPTARIEDVTGKFNDHLARCCVVFADEAIAAESMRQESLLKPLVTDPILSCEPKGLPKTQEPNMISFLMASNHEFVVKAGDDSRRFCVVDVLDDRRGDLVFWKKVNAELDRGGRAAFLDHLLKIDLEGFDPQAFPITDALLDQRDKSLDSMSAFWRDRLAEGEHGDEFVDTWERVPKELLWRQFLDYVRAAGKRGEVPTNKIEFGRALSKLLGDYKLKQGRPMAWNWHGKEQPISNAYDLPSLEECREAFEEHVGRKINWPEQIDDPEHLSPSDIWSRIKNIRSNLMDDYKKLALVKRWRTGEKEELEAEIAESEEHIEMLKRGLDDGTSY